MEETVPTDANKSLKGTIIKINITQAVSMKIPNYEYRPQYFLFKKRTVLLDFCHLQKRVRNFDYYMTCVLDLHTL